MNKKLADRIFALLLTALVLGFMAMAMQLNTTARRMPMIVAAFTLVCLVAYFAGEFWPRKAAQPKPKPEKPVPLAECEPAAAPAPDALPWWDVRVWGWLIVLFACIYLAGIVGGIGLLTFVFYRFAAKGSWVRSIIFGVIMAAFIFGVFEIAFKETLFRGIIYEALVG